MEINGFKIDEYNIYKFKEGEKTAICPFCSHNRKPHNQKVKCMSLFWDTGLGVCNHCSEKRIQLHTYKRSNEEKTYLKPVVRAEKTVISDKLYKYAKEQRGIKESTLEALKISSLKTWMPKAKKEIDTIQIPYFFLGKLINIKSRGANKDFKFEKGCEKIIYNIDSIIGEKECIITEGEPDTWSYVDVGITNCVSVPNGFTLPRSDGSSSINTSYLDDYYHIFESKEKIYLALDNDEAGKCGEKELIIRFGAEKCWLVDFKDCKDANEYKLKYGDEALRDTIKDAKQVPLEYVESLSDFESELEDFWLNGSPKGFTTGIRDLDEMYSTEHGQYTILTGPPGSGKSELSDSMCLGYALKYGFKTAFASPENKPNKFHADKIIRKIAGFRPSTKHQISSESITLAKDFYNNHFYHIEFNGYDLDSTLSKFEELVKRKGVKFFVIDPFNKIKLKSASKLNINDYTNEYLNKIDIFCKKNYCNVILVAHPIKMEKEEGTNTFKMPTPYQVKGGGEMYDMTYHMLGIVKNIEEGLVRVRALKIKFQHLGVSDKDCWFGWNINNGRYTDVNFDPSLGEKGVINWDNKSWIVGNGEVINTEGQEVPLYDMTKGETQEHLKTSDEFLSEFESENIIDKPLPF